MNVAVRLDTPGTREAYRACYPFDDHWLALPAGRMHYLDEGPRDAPVLLMLHGNPTWSFYFRELVRGLSDRYRVVVPDHLGLGLSEKPEANFRLEDRIGHVEALIEHLGLRAITLCLHDWGGAIGMGVAVRHPDWISAFVIFNTAAFLSQRIPFTIDLCRHPFFGAAFVQGLNAFVRVALIRAVAQRARLTRAVRAGYLAPYPDYESRRAIRRFVEDIPLSNAHPSYDTLATIDRGLAQFRDFPMMIVWGERDFCFDLSFLAEWRRRFPKAEVYSLPDASHYVVEDAYERIVPWMRLFMERA